MTVLIDHLSQIPKHINYFLFFSIKLILYCDCLISFNIKNLAVLVFTFNFLLQISPKLPNIQFNSSISSKRTASSPYNDSGGFHTVAPWFSNTVQSPYLTFLSHIATSARNIKQPWLHYIAVTHHKSSKQDSKVFCAYHKESQPPKVLFCYLGVSFINAAWFFFLFP